jgi:hypothetical protein
MSTIIPRTYDRLRCECGRIIRHGDFEAHGDDVHLICPSCHQDLLQIELMKDDNED